MTFSSPFWEAEVVTHTFHSRNWGHFLNGQQNDVSPLDRGITRLYCQTNTCLPEIGRLSFDSSQDRCSDIKWARWHIHAKEILKLQQFSQKADFSVFCLVFALLLSPGNSKVFLFQNSRYCLVHAHLAVKFPLRNKQEKWICNFLTFSHPDWQPSERYLVRQVSGLSLEVLCED